MSDANYPRPFTPVEPSCVPSEGWHCTHLFYRFDRGWPNERGAISAGCGCFEQILAPVDPDAPERLQTSIVSGHKADFGLMLMDRDPLKIDRLHQRLVAALGNGVLPTYSFVSLTEVSEYVPTVEQYGQRLVAEGDSRAARLRSQVNAYRRREPIMRQQRLRPDFRTGRPRVSIR